MTDEGSGKSGGESQSPGDGLNKSTNLEPAAYRFVVAEGDGIDENHTVVKFSDPRDESSIEGIRRKNQDVEDVEELFAASDIVQELQTLSRIVNRSLSNDDIDNEHALVQLNNKLLELKSEISSLEVEE